MEEFMLAMLVSRPTSLGGVSSLGSRASHTEEKGKEEKEGVSKSHCSCYGINLMKKATGYCQSVRIN